MYTAYFLLFAFMTSYTHYFLRQELHVPFTFIYEPENPAPPMTTENLSGCFSGASDVTNFRQTSQERTTKMHLNAANSQKYGVRENIRIVLDEDASVMKNL